MRGNRTMIFVLACVLSLFVFTGLTGATEEPIRIGLLGPQTGVFAAFGEYQVQGNILALEEVDYQVAGRPIEVFIEDTRGDVERLVTLLRLMQERDEVHVVVGPTLGGEGLAALDWATDSGMPMVICYSAPEDITMRQAVFNVVRAGWTGAQPHFPFGEYVAQELGYKRLVLIGQDYSFPYNQAGGFIRGFLRNGGEEVINIWHPVGTDDFSSILATFPRDVDAVMYNGAGTDAVHFYRQWFEFGLDAEFPLLGASNATDYTILPELGEDVIGVITAQHYAEGLEHENFIRFRDAFVERWDAIPACPAEHGYVGVKMVLEAVEAIDGNIEDEEAFINALRQTNMPDAPRGPIYLDDYGNPVQNIYVREVQLVDGVLLNVPIKTYENVTQFGPYADRPEAYMAQPPDSRDFPPGTLEEFIALEEEYGLR